MVVSTAASASARHKYIVPYRYSTSRNKDTFKVSHKFNVSILPKPTTRTQEHFWRIISLNNTSYGYTSGLIIMGNIVKLIYYKIIIFLRNKVGVKAIKILKQEINDSDAA